LVLLEMDARRGNYWCLVSPAGGERARSGGSVRRKSPFKATYTALQVRRGIEGLHFVRQVLFPVTQFCQTLPVSSSINMLLLINLETVRSRRWN
jgi:hypothetical protein